MSGPARPAERYCMRRSAHLRLNLEAVVCKDGYVKENESRDFISFYVALWSDKPLCVTHIKRETLPLW